MSQTPTNNPKPVRPSLLALAWQVLRWSPLATMFSTLLLVGVLMFMGGIEKIIGWYLLQLIPPILGLVFLIAVIIYFIVRHRLSKLAAVTGGLALVCLSAFILWFVPITYPASLSATTPTATVRLPADVPLTVLWGGDSMSVNNHAAVPDQRWAYDLAVAPYLTGSTALTDYGCFGVAVVAPVSGEVTAAHDGEPDQTPGVLSNNLEAPFGNHVTIRLESDTYLVIAHLRMGSVAVTTGQQVEEGQVIGQCGNSGNTSEPHIHIHHQRQDPTVYPVNFAEGLPLFFRDHDGDPMPQGGVRVDGESITATGATVQHFGK